MDAESRCEVVLRDVVVVGGGVAGMTAVKTLLDHNINNLVLLEAQDYLGGRVKTFRQGDILVEDGAEWIHGDTRNPLHRLAASIKAVDNIIPDEDWDVRVVTGEGHEGDGNQWALTKAVMEDSHRPALLKPHCFTSNGHILLQKLVAGGMGTKEYQVLHQYLQQNINYEFGVTCSGDMSVRDANRYKDYGCDEQWKDGFDTLINHLKAGIPDSVVRLSSPVKRIYWDTTGDDGRVLVLTEKDGQQGGFLARHVIVTASVGYLKGHHRQMFRPSLPPTMITALAGIELGVANKVQVGWQQPWWGNNKPLHLNIFHTNYLHLPHNMAWLRGVALFSSVHRHLAVLQTFVTGAHSRTMEALPEQQVQEHVCFLLATVTGLHVPQPTFFRRSQWGQNPWTLGSYSSYVTREGERAGLQHRSSHLAQPLTNSNGKVVLSWAGEHTHNTRYGSVDGAMETGHREGNRILNLLEHSLASHLPDPLS